MLPSSDYAWWNANSFLAKKQKSVKLSTFPASGSLKHQRDRDRQWQSQLTIFSDAV
jgi:hypothetical protein